MARSILRAMMDAVMRAHVAGDIDRAADMFDVYLSRARYELQPGPGVPASNYVLAERGAIASPVQRHPSVALSSDDIADIEWLIGQQERWLAALG